MGTWPRHSTWKGYPYWLRGSAAALLSVIRQVSLTRCRVCRKLILLFRLLISAAQLLFYCALCSRQDHRVQCIGRAANNRGRRYTICVNVLLEALMHTSHGNAGYGNVRRVSSTGESISKATCVLHTYGRARHLFSTTLRGLKCRQLSISTCRSCKSTVFARTREVVSKTALPRLKACRPPDMVSAVPSYCEMQERRWPVVR